MSRAKEAFVESIKDAENLLRHFNTLNSHPPPPEIEVLKRAGLIMAMTAWETYVEDRLVEATTERLGGLNDSAIASLVLGRLDEEIRKLHNPTSQKTIQLFRDFTGVDLTECWTWNNYEPKTVREALNRYQKLRGDIVHRSRPINDGPPVPDPVTKEKLQKAISFLKNLVDATEKAFG